MIVSSETGFVAIDDDMLAVQKVEAVPKILDVICRVTGMGFAAVARVADDEIYVGHHTPARYGFQSYVSVPIILSDGTFFGTLCAIDPRPAVLKDRHAIRSFLLFAQLIATQLDAIKNVAASSASLFDERQASEWREQFIAVMGHDFRNPLASSAAGVRMFPKAESGRSSSDFLSLMAKSIKRMSQFIDDVLDLARGRLGGGLVLHVQPTDLAPMLDLVVAELKIAHPEIDFDVVRDLQAPVDCDAERIGRRFSNLLANAVSHGAAGQPIRVEAKADRTEFGLTTANHGDPIPPSTVGKLFLPFYRGEEVQSGVGLGLGLYSVRRSRRLTVAACRSARTPARPALRSRYRTGRLGSLDRPSRTLLIMTATVAAASALRRTRALRLQIRTYAKLILQAGQLPALRRHANAKTIGSISIASRTRLSRILIAIVSDTQRLDYVRCL